MPERDPAAHVLDRLAALKTLHQGRNLKRQEWKWLRRGIDPRKMQTSSGRTSFPKLTEMARLRTNDPVTFFNTAVHLLSARDVKWRLPSVAGEGEGEIRSYGLIERFVASMFRQNDERLLKTGRPRLQRSLADAACEIGFPIVYREAGVRNGLFYVRFDPVNPKGVYERFDDEGLAEIANEFEVPVEDARVEAERKRWTFPAELSPKSRKAGVVMLIDYWKREWVDGLSVVKNTVLLDSKVAQDETEKGEIPFEGRYVSGESFPDEFARRAENASAYMAQSILEPNAKTYLDESDFTAKLHLYLDEILKAAVQEFTSGGVPRANPDALNPARKERPIFTYDSLTDKGLVPMDVAQLPAAIGLLGQDLAGQIQRGSASYLSMGNVSSDLSGAGFAINQLLERDSVAAREASIVLASMYESLALWMLKAFREQPTAKAEVRGFVASSGNREFFHEEVTPADLPEKLDVMAEIELARPSDLVVRANTARALNPGVTRLISKRAVLEGLLADLAPDVQREIDDLRLEELAETEQFKVLEMLKGLQEKRIKAEGEGDADAVAFIDQQLELLRSTFKREGNQPAGGPGAGGVPAPEVLSTPTRTRGVTQPGRPAPQLVR